MRLIKAILVGLIAVFSHKLAWEMAVKGVSKDAAKSEVKMEATVALSNYTRRRQRNLWSSAKSNKLFDLPILITKR